MTSTLYFIVPVYNEAPNLPRLLDAFREIEADFPAYSKQFILVDDGSKDDTPTEARKLQGNLPLTILEHGGNKGPGYAFGTAFEYLANRVQPDDWVVTLEGDNTSRHELLRQMFHRAEAEGYDVILASPYLYGGGIINTDGLRIFLSKMANVFVKEILGLHGIVTVSSFYRLHRATVIQKLQQRYGPRIIQYSGFECMIEMLIKMVYLQTTLSEVAMVLDTKRRIGKSKMKIWRTIMGYLRLYTALSHWKRQAGA